MRTVDFLRRLVTDTLRDGSPRKVLEELATTARAADEEEQRKQGTIPADGVAVDQEHHGEEEAKA